MDIMLGDWLELVVSEVVTSGNTWHFLYNCVLEANPEGGTAEQDSKGTEVLIIQEQLNAASNVIT